jgi:hypothetical protein
MLTHFVLHMLCTRLSLPRYALVEFESQLCLPGLATVSSDNFLFPVSDRTILAVHCTGSSVTVSLDDVTALWLKYLDLPGSCLGGVNAFCTPASSAP